MLLLVVLSLMAALGSGAPEPPGYGSGWEEGPGLSVQSGYEGYLVPAPEPATHSLLSALSAAGLASALIPPLAKIGLKVAFWAFNLLGLFLLGSVFTTAVCTLTPFCTISFLGLGFTREDVRSLISQDRLSQLTHFVSKAIDKYRKIQKDETQKKVKKEKIQNR